MLPSLSVATPENGRKAPNDVHEPPCAASISCELIGCTVESVISTMLYLATMRTRSTTSLAAESALHGF